MKKEIFLKLLKMLHLMAFSSIMIKVQTFSIAYTYFWFVNDVKRKSYPHVVATYNELLSKIESFLELMLKANLCSFWS